MKVIVERSPSIHTQDAMFWFYCVIDDLNKYTTKEQVREWASHKLIQNQYDTGFGKNHFWLHEKNNPKRLVIVEF